MGCDDSVSNDPDPDPDPTPQTTVSISGTIVDEDTGDPVSGADVSVEDADSGNSYASGSTNSSGDYALEFTETDDQLPDELRFVAEAENYDPFETVFDAAESITQDVELAPEERFAGGSGTESDPYQIETAGHLQDVNEHLDATFELTGDIDLSTASEAKNTSNFEPIGSVDNVVDSDDTEAFTGTFDGNGFTISGLTIDREGDAGMGLFAVVEGEVRNLTVSDANIVGGNPTGVIAGAVLEGGTLESVSATGAIEGEDSRAGGVAGLNRGTILDAYAAVDLTIEGGSSSMTRARSTGGLVGANSGDEARIEDSYATGDVRGDWRVGGLVGHNTNSASVHTSYATGDATGDSRVGGVAGKQEDDAAIHDSYASGTVDSDGDEAGGLVGRNFRGAEIHTSYATGAVSGSAGAATTGGVAGSNTEGGVVGTVYWDTETTDQDDGVGTTDQGDATGLTTNEMTGSSAESTMDALDFDAVWTTQSGTYPTLQWDVE